MSNYGFTSSDEIKLDSFGYPLGKYKVMIIREEDVPSGVNIGAEILTGEHKGTVANVYYNTLSDNVQVANIAQKDLRRIADATGKPVTPTTPLKGRVFVVDVVPNKKNASFTNVKSYLPESESVDAEPESNDAPF